MVYTFGTIKPDRITVDEEGCKVQRLFGVFERTQRHPQTRWPGRGNAGSAAKMNAVQTNFGLFNRPLNSRFYQAKINRWKVSGRTATPAPVILEKSFAALPSPATKKFMVSYAEIGRRKPLHVQNEKRRPCCQGRRVEWIIFSSILDQGCSLFHPSFPLRDLRVLASDDAMQI